MRAVTEEEAAAAVVAYLEQAWSGSFGREWEAAVTHVEDAGALWRVFYNSKAYLESGNVSDALAGNWPYLVPKDGGPIRPDLEYRDAALGQ